MRYFYSCPKRTGSGVAWPDIPHRDRVVAMPPEYRQRISSFKSLLSLVACAFAFSAAVLIYLGTSAATVTGGTPGSAVFLIDGANTGVLGPGEQRWFKFKPDQQGRPVDREKLLFFSYVPDTADPGAPLVFQLFDSSQVQFFRSGNASRMTSFGTGQQVSRDDQPETGELSWTGRLRGQQIYYVYVVNSGQQKVNYRLYIEDVTTGPLDQPVSQPAVPVAVEPVSPARFAPSPVPQLAVSLNPNVNKGNLEPGQETWYRFLVADADQDIFEPMALTLVATPDDGNRIGHLALDIFTAGEISKWSPGADSVMTNLGSGGVVYRDDNPWTGERVWAGWVVDGENYFVRIRNSADAPMDYWLFAGDIYSPELGN